MPAFAWPEILIATEPSALTAQQSGEGELYVIRREGPKERPTLVPFVGEPRKMLLHQLLMSPMFGLETMDSVEVEEARSDVRRLSSKKSVLTAAEKTRYERSKTVLAASPDWDAVPKYAREQTALLKGIKASMVTNGKSPKLSPRKLKATAKALGAVK